MDGAAVDLQAVAAASLVVVEVLAEVEVVDHGNNKSKLLYIRS